MSNRIDFFGPEQMQLAVPAGKPQVFLEGQLCPFLEVSEIVRASDPGFSRARLTYNTSGLENANVILTECIETIVPMGKPISIHSSCLTLMPRRRYCFTGKPGSQATSALAQ